MDLEGPWLDDDRLADRQTSDPLAGAVRGLQGCLQQAPRSDRMAQLLRLRRSRRIRAGNGACKVYGSALDGRVQFSCQPRPRLRTRRFQLESDGIAVVVVVVP